jgi:hypothetical protein
VWRLQRRIDGLGGESQSSVQSVVAPNLRSRRHDAPPLHAQVTRACPLHRGTGLRERPPQHDEEVCRLADPTRIARLPTLGLSWLADLLPDGI